MVQGSKNNLELTNSSIIEFGTNASISSAANQINLNNNTVVNGNLNTTQAISYNTLTTSSSALSLTDQHNYIFYIGSTDFTVTLPDPTTCPGRKYSLQNYGQSSTLKFLFSGYTVYVNGYTAPVSSLQNGASAEIISDGTVWRKVY